MENFSDFTRLAFVPEHLEHYVRAMGACRPMRLASLLAWRHETSLILTGFPCTGTQADSPEPGEEAMAAVDAAVEEALALPWLKDLTVLSFFRPRTLPADSLCREDAYWGLSLPVPQPRGKLANMLRRATVLVDIRTRDAWSAEHEALVSGAAQDMARRPGERRLSPESLQLFARLGDYVRANPATVACYSARRKDDGRLCGLAVADHASYSTAFYLFAFRTPDAPPGTADALLAAILQEGTRLGQRLCNLGLGLHPGIRFFKQKWGARILTPYVECSWQRPDALSRLFGLFRRRRA